MDIKDEIDVMLNSLKDGKRNTSAPKKQVTPPPAPTAKSVYDKMSLDELLTAISDNEKQLPDELEKMKTAPVGGAEKTPEKSVERVRKNVPDPTVRRKKKTSSENKIPQNLLDMLSVNGGTAAQQSESPKVQSIRTPIEKEDFREIIGSEPVETVKDPEPMVSHEPVPVFMQEFSSDEVSYASDVNVESAEEEAHVGTESVLEAESETEEAPETFSEYEISESDVDYDEKVKEDIPKEDKNDESETEESVPEPKKERKKLFGGLKELFAKRRSDVQKEKLSAEEADEDEKDVSDENTDEIQPVFNTCEEPEEKNSLEEKSDDASDKTSLEKLSDAAEMVDAAITAIESLNMESSEEITPSEPENYVAEDSEESPADELIADIREDAANVISDISTVNSENDDNNEAPENETDEDEAEDETCDEDNDVENDDINIDIGFEAVKKKGRIVSALEKILDEDPDVISGERSEKAETDEIDISVENRNKGKLRRHIYAFFGIILTVLAVIGLVFSVNYATRCFRSFTAGEDKKDSFADAVYPAVIIDIESFYDPSELSSEQIISAALWSLVMSEDDMEKYEQTFDIISVPAIDVEAYAARLFGNNLPEITHTTVGSGDVKFYYNDAAKSYNVPVNPITFTYEPEITSVSKTDDEYTVVVDYVKELPSWMKDNSESGKEVSKTVEFKLHENNGFYSISSMTVLNVNEVI